MLTIESTVIIPRGTFAMQGFSYELLREMYGDVVYKAGHLLVHMSTGKILFVKEKNGNWGPPKGSNNDGESTPLETATRETAEEIGFIPTSAPEYIIVIIRRDLDRPAIFVYFVTPIDFSSTVQLILDPSEITSVRLYTAIEARRIKRMSACTRAAIEIAMNMFL